MTAEKALRELKEYFEQMTALNQRFLAGYGHDIRETERLSLLVDTYAHAVEMCDAYLDKISTGA